MLYSIKGEDLINKLQGQVLKYQLFNSIGRNLNETTI